MGDLDSSLATHAMTELVNAVNERVQVLRQMTGRASAGTYYERVGAGPANHFPSYDDMRGLTLGTLRTDGLVSTVAGNLQDCIGDLAPFFLKSHTTSPAAYTLYASAADLLGDGSYGASWLPTNRLQSTDMWLQMREALEKLIYPTGTLTPTTFTKRTRYAGGPGQATMQEAWDIANTGSIDSRTGPLVGATILLSTYGLAYGNPPRVPSDPITAMAWVDHSVTCTFTLPSPAVANSVLYYSHAYRQFAGWTERAITLSDNQGASSVIGAGVWPITPDYNSNLFAKSPAPSGATTFTLAPNDLVNDPWTDSTSPFSNTNTFWFLGPFLHTGDLSALMTFG